MVTQSKVFKARHEELIRFLCSVSAHACASDCPLRTEQHIDYLNSLACMERLQVWRRLLDLFGATTFYTICDEGTSACHWNGGMCGCFMSRRTQKITIFRNVLENHVSAAVAEFDVCAGPSFGFARDCVREGWRSNTWSYDLWTICAGQLTFM